MAAPSALAPLFYNPFTARFRFKFREPTNWLMCFAAFALIAAIVALVMPGIAWLIDIGVIAILAFLNFFVLHKRSIKVLCPHCLELIDTNVPWTCGCCGKKNMRTDDFPFVYRCEDEKCHAQPPAYKCHHCHNVVFLTRDRRQQGWAASPDFSTEGTKRDDRAATKTAMKELMEDKTDALAIAELDAKLREIDAKHRPPKVKTPAEQMAEMCDREYQGSMGIREYCRKKSKEVAEKYKDSPDDLRDANEAIEAIHKRHC